MGPAMVAGQSIGQKTGEAPGGPEASRLWCLPESNWGHMDFQSIALPAELRHQYVRPIFGPERSGNCWGGKDRIFTQQCYRP